LTKGKDAAQNSICYHHRKARKLDPFATQKRSGLTPEQAEMLAVSALSYLSETPELMQRFLSLSGIEASNIRQAAAEPHFFAGILKFFLAHEPSLMELCAARNLDPQDVSQAVRQLPGGQD
jgi:Protein of unknown function (DUF3572)